MRDDWIADAVREPSPQRGLRAAISGDSTLCKWPAGVSLASLGYRRFRGAEIVLLVLRAE